METALSKFKKEHPYCVVEEVEVYIAEEIFTCQVILVAGDGWTIETSCDDRGSNPVLLTTMYPKTELMESHQWSLLNIDVYLLTPWSLNTYLRLSTDNTPKDGNDFPEVESMKCMKVGTVNLSSDFGTEKPDRLFGTILQCQYTLDLRCHWNAEIYASNTPYIEMKFNIYKKAPHAIQTRGKGVEHFHALLRELKQMSI